MQIDKIRRRQQLDFTTSALFPKASFNASAPFYRIKTIQLLFLICSITSIVFILLLLQS